MSPQRLYDTAWSDFTAGQWALCIEGFSTYLKSYSRTDAADDAQWYIGECLFSGGKFAEAIDAFNRVIANYPKGDRVPDAYYKRGLALSSIGQVDRARTVVEATRIFALAESLGGVESLIGHPASMTHASVPQALRDEMGLTASLVRLSVGIEDVGDLMADLDRALSS